MIRFAQLSCLALILAFGRVAEATLVAQSPDAAMVAFAQLVVDQDYSPDDARAIVANQFGAAAATDAAVYWCEPEPGEGCDESDLWAAWERFIDLVESQEVGVDAAEMEIAEAFDGQLAAAIAVFWCAPEPYTGCDVSHAGAAWSNFLSRVEEGGQGPAGVRDAMAQEAPLLASAIYAYLCGPDERCGSADPGGVETPRVAQTGAGRRHYRNKDCKTSPKPPGC